MSLLLEQSKRRMKFSESGPRFLKRGCWKDESLIGTIQKQNEVLRERAKVLEERVLENEKRLKEKRVVWQLCSGHELNGKAVGCSKPQEGKTCPFYASSTKNLLDIFVKIPKAFEAALRGLSC